MLANFQRRYFGRSFSHCCYSSSWWSISCFQLCEFSLRLRLFNLLVLNPRPQLCGLSFAFNFAASPSHVRLRDFFLSASDSQFFKASRPFALQICADLFFRPLVRGFGFAPSALRHWCLLRLRDLRPRIFQLHLRDLRLQILPGFDFEASASSASRHRPLRLRGVGFAAALSPRL